MLKLTFFVLSFVILGFAGNSQGGVFADLLCNPTNKGAFSQVAEVREFVRTFVGAVEASDTLKNVFNLTKTTPKEYSDFVKMHSAQSQKKIGVDEKTATTIANYMAEFITKFKSLTTRVVAVVLGNAAADFLYVDGQLTPGNSQSLARDLVKSIEDLAKENEKASKFIIVNNGFKKLFIKDGEFIPTKVPILGFFVGTEWREGTLNTCLS